MPSWILSSFADEAGGKTEEQLAACKTGGLNYIDPRNVDGHNIAKIPLDVAQQVAKLYEAAGVKVNMYGSPIGKIDVADDVQADLDMLEHLGKLKNIFGCSGVRFFSYYNKTGLSHSQWRDKVMDRLKQLRDKAGQLGLVLYHENESHIFGDKSDDVLEIAQLRDGETFKMIYDFANYIRTGEDGLDTWQKCKDHTDYFHFKDQRKDGQHMPMGQGETDSQRILKDAVDSGLAIDGCTLEPHLSFSKAVITTHASGSGAKALADLPPAETFQIAVDGAKKIMADVGVTPM